MKKYFLDNIRVLSLILSFIFIIILINIFDKHNTSIKGDVYEFTSIKEGDIIPFNSRIVGNFNLRMKFQSSDNKTIHYITSKFIKACHTNVYYCKSNECLENQKYNTIRNLYHVGNSTEYDFNVSNYKAIFGRSNNNYTGWEVHFLPFTYTNENYHTMYIGTYYDIVLIPTSSKDNKCLDNIENYGISKDYKIVDKSNSFNIEDNSFYLNYNTVGYIDIRFSAKKGDRVLFDLNTTSDTLKMYLNNEDITSVLNLSDENNYYRYNTKIINIEEDGEYILHFKEDTVDDDSNTFERIVNIKNFTIFSPSSKSSADTYYTSCYDDIIMGKVK